MDSYYNKYLKYKKKYIDLKNNLGQIGGDYTTDFLEFNSPSNTLSRTGAYVFLDSTIKFTKISAGANGFTFITERALLISTAPTAAPKVTTIALKTSLNKDSDNNYREFAVGQCINKFKIYSPNWAYTYSYWSYKDNRESKGKIRNIITTNLPNFKWSYLEPQVDTTSVTRSLDADIMTHAKIENGCLKNHLSSIVIEYVPNSTRLSDFIASADFNAIDFLTILYQVYAALVSVSVSFTHYDLHAENILLSKLPDYIELTYTKGNLLNNTDFKFKTKYIPVIIDYGRAYVNCMDDKLNFISSAHITDSACNTMCNTLPHNDLNASCNINEYGYFDVQRNSDGTYNPVRYHISINKINNTHDLRLVNFCFSILSITNPGFSFAPPYANLIMEWRNLNRNVVWDNPVSFFGAEHNGISGFNFSPTSAVNNIRDCLLWLTKKINSNKPLFELAAGEKYYGKINIHSLNDVPTPWEFIPNLAYVP